MRKLAIVFSLAVVLLVDGSRIASASRQPPAGKGCVGAIVAEGARTGGSQFGAFVSDQATAYGQEFGVFVSHLATTCEFVLPSE